MTISGESTLMPAEQGIANELEELINAALQRAGGSTLIEVKVPGLGSAKRPVRDALARRFEQQGWKINRLPTHWVFKR